MADDQLKALAELSRLNKDKLAQIYRLAEIAALSQVKEQISRWLLVWGTVITVLLTTLAFFGVHTLVRNTVDDELDTHKTKIVRAQLETDVLLNRMTTQEKNINVIIRKFDPFITSLQEIDKRDKFAAALTNLVLDFYAIKDIEIYVHVTFKEPVGEQKTPRRTFLFGVDLVHNDKNVARFLTDHANMLSGRQAGRIYALAYRLLLYYPDFKRLNGRPIRELSTTSIRFRRVLPKEETADRFISAYESLKNLEVDIVVNGVTILKDERKELKFTKAKRKDGRFLVTATHPVTNLAQPALALETAIAERIAALKMRRDDLGLK